LGVALILQKYEIRFAIVVKICKKLRETRLKLNAIIKKEKKKTATNFKNLARISISIFKKINEN
jgi:hypothetical protein